MLLQRTLQTTYLWIALQCLKNHGVPDFVPTLAENNIISLLMVKDSDTTQETSVAHTLQKYDIT